MRERTNADRTCSSRARRTLAAAALVFLAGVTGALAEPRDLGDGVWVDRIAAGPRLLLIPQRSVPMFSCTVLVPAGSALETPATNGAAHYLEHLLFNGTTSRSREEIYALGDLLGAYNNASTQRERTVFQLLLPSENWREGLELQADMLLRSTLPRDMFEKEKGIILEELAKDRTDAGYEAERFGSRSFWGDDPRSLPVLGTEESISNMDPEAVAAFYRDRYQPAGLTMLVMGDFDVGEVRAEIEKLYGGPAAAAAGPPAPLPARPDFPADPVVHYRDLDDLGKIQVRLMLPAPGLSSPDLAAAMLLADVLDSGEHAAVSRAVEAACGTTLSASVGLDVGEPWSRLTIAVDLPEGGSGGEKEGTRAPAVGAILQHLIAVARGPEIPADVETARLNRVVDEISLREKMHYYGLMRADLFGGDDPAAADRALKRLGRVLPTRLQAVLLNAVYDGRAVATVVGPGVGSGTESLAPVADPREKMKGAEGFATEPIRIGSPATTDVTATTRTVFDDGLTFVNHVSPDSRTFAVQVLLRDRSALEERNGVPRGTADVVHRLMSLGTDALSEDELRGRLARLGAKLKVTDSDWIPYDDYYYTPEFSYVRLETIDAFAIDAIAVLGDVLKRPRFDEASFQKAVAAAAVRAEKDAGRPRERASRAFYEALGEGHPLAGGVHGSAEEIRALTLEAARRHHASMIEPSNLIVAVSGSRPAATVEAAVRGALGGSRAASPASAVAFRPRKVRGSARVEVETGQEQSWLILGSPVEPEPDDEPALRVATAVLSERLADRLREREALAYSIGAGGRLEGPGAHVSMSAGTRPENLVRMEEGMREVARSLVGEPPLPAEVEGARNRGEGRQRMRRLSRIGQAYALAIAELYGRDPENLDADSAALRAVTPDDVVRVADRYLGFESSICAIAR